MENLIFAGFMFLWVLIVAGVFDRWVAYTTPMKKPPA
jgi:hypothetical protein